MQKHIAALAVVALGASLAAQSTFTAPAGFATKSGNSQAFNQALNLAASFCTGATWQISTTDMPASRVTLSALSYRPTSSRSYSSVNGMGRTANRLTLTLGYAAPTMTTTFSMNWKAAGTEVIPPMKFTLPTIPSGTPKPDWGKAGEFKFTTHFMWDSSKGNLLQEWSHSGGAMANGYTSSALYLVDGNFTAPIGQQTVSMLPSSSSTAPHRYVPHSYLNPKGGACNDSAITLTTHSAYSLLHGQIHANLHQTYSVRGKLTVGGVNSYYTAPGGRVIGFLSVGGDDKGLRHKGIGCNNLHVNPLNLLTILTRKANTRGTTVWTGPGGVSRTPVPYDDRWAGSTIYWQAIWDDSMTKQPKFTIATKITLPKKPVFVPTPELATYVYSYTYGTIGKAGPYLSRSASHNPIDLWTWK